MANQGLRIGIESKIEYNSVLDIWGDRYESIRRTGLNDMQSGMRELEIEKTYQSRFDLQWAWADSIATEVSQTYKQLNTAKKLNIARISEQIKKKVAKAKAIFKSLSKVRTPTARQKNQALGLRSKLLKIQSLKAQLASLKSNNRLHICYGSKKLFNAQHHLAENGYSSHEEWLAYWRKKRGGRFFCIGKSTHGGGTMIKIRHVSGDNFKAIVTLPRLMQAEHGQKLEIPFQVSECRRRRKSSLLYALEQQKPITVQIFRREYKQDNWYIHLTTYVQSVPVTTSFDNGCIGVDFNRDSVEWAYVLADGNIKNKGKLAFRWRGFSTGQRQVIMRDLVARLVEMAFDLQCPIAIESLDFSKKKAAMSEASRTYNSMLSNLATSTFKEALISRCNRYGIGLNLVNPAFTSVIGMIKFMGRYGLNSGTAAAMTVARRAMGMSERPPTCLVRPEDRARHVWTTWNRVSRYLKSNYVRRSQLFDWMKTLEAILVSSDIDEMTSCPSLASSQSDRKTDRNSPSPNPKQNLPCVQLCLSFQ